MFNRTISLGGFHELREAGLETTLNVRFNTSLRERANFIGTKPLDLSATLSIQARVHRRRAPFCEHLILRLIVLSVCAGKTRMLSSE
jgi:hypothetical protein